MWTTNEKQRMKQRISLTTSNKQATSAVIRLNKERQRIASLLIVFFYLIGKYYYCGYPLCESLFTLPMKRTLALIHVRKIKVE